MIIILISFFLPFFTQLAIESVSAPIDPRVICKQVSPNDKSLFTQLYVEWYGPAQIASGKSLTRFDVVFKEKDGIEQARTIRDVSEVSFLC